MSESRVSSWVKRMGEIFRRGNRAKKSLIISLATVGLLSLLYAGYSLAYLGKIYPRVTVGSVAVGGLTKEEAKTTLEAAAQKNQTQPIQLQYQDKNFTLSPSEVDWQFTSNVSIDEAYAWGRNGHFWTSLAAQLSAPFRRHQVTPAVTIDAEKLNQKLVDLAKPIDQPAVDASAKFVGDKLVVASEKAGSRIDLDELKLTILGQWSQFQPDRIELVTKVDQPKVVAGSTEALTAQAETLAAQALAVTWPGGQKQLTKKELKQLIAFTGQPQTLTAQFGLEKVKTFTVNLAKDIDRPAKDPKLVIKDGALVVVSNSQVGAVVDVNVSSAAILAALNNKTASAELTIVAQNPVITENNLEPLGIKERIGVAQTSFVGSPANRRANIVNGVNILQSALIKPGEEFSTVKTLGAVNDATGFLPELVIKEDRTVPEFGGGLCQVSTTLFRAVMNAGLRVSERQNHSYRVSYYEPPIGMDATIYLPKPDFKFVNTTDRHILVQGQVVGSKVIFELWGTNDGRTATLTTPVVSNIIEPGEPIYANTDTLLIGETKQIEKPHQGATAVFVYTVTRNGQEINKQTFKSVYKAWPARFLVGTRDPAAPPPAP